MTTRKQQTGIDSAAKATMTIYKQWAEDGLMAVKGIGARTVEINDANILLDTAEKK